MDVITTLCTGLNVKHLYFLTFRQMRWEKQLAINNLEQTEKWLSSTQHAVQEDTQTPDSGRFRLALSTADPFRWVVTWSA